MCRNGHETCYLKPMKFKFKIQEYQTNAVENMTAVFAGQPGSITTDELLYRLPRYMTVICLLIFLRNFKIDANIS